MLIRRIAGDGMSKILQVKPTGEYRLEVQLDNGSTIILNMQPRIATIRFAMLQDKELFDSVSTDGDFIRWGNKIDISVTEIFQLAQK